MRLKNLISKVGKEIKDNLGTIVSTILIGATVGNSTMIYVPAGSSIQTDGIDAANAGDTVKVGPGTFIEDITLKPGVAVLGSSPDSTILAGDGVIVTGGDSTSIFGNIKVVPTDTTSPSWGYMILDSTSNPILIKNVFTGKLYCGVHCGNNGRPIMINNTITNCRAAGIVYGGNSAPIIENNIVSGNKEGIYHYGNGDPLAFATMEYNDVWGNITNYSFAAGTDTLHDQTGIKGNISADPLFVKPDSGNYHLGTDPRSPCIDAGNPDTLFNDDDGTRNDMGAFYSNQTGIREKTLENKVSDIKAYPNPFTHKVIISKKNTVIYNASGRVVAECKEGVWDGKDNKGKEASSGEYFVKDKDGKYSVSVAKISN